MAGQTYQVNYIVNVDATNARTAINLFKQSIASMDKAIAPIVELQRTVNGLVQTMTTLNRGSWMVHLDTSSATQKIGKLIRGLELAKKKVQELNASSINLTGVANSKGNKGKGSSSAQSTSSNKPAPAVASTSSAKPKSNKPRPASVAPIRKSLQKAAVGPTNLGYKLWGPTPLPNNGGMAIDMLKGMGIAYGIAGIGTLVSNIVGQAAEYDNLMKTVENILKSHDMDADFASRFSTMATTVRNVGMETKFKVTEVADAAKFLAMAGLDVEAISQAIRPIADIALVGDTELGATADLVTNIMTAYNVSPNKMRNAADVMTNTFTMSNTTLTEIAESYKYAASLLSAGNVPFEEATAAIGVLGDAGIKGSQAGTTLRTIMANVVNPTKKQKAAWEEIGIDRYNSDGSRKSLLEIFKELNNAKIDVGDYYRLFHKTAASGAVALAAHVSKWEDVYLENYFAGGLSARLADEKKNTLQGLWAQLVSVFTDKGVTVFSGVQGQLRSLMTEAMNWLKTDDATQKFKDISKTLMEFVNMMVEASKIFMGLFKIAEPFVKMWVKFQILIWPVVNAVTALRRVILGFWGLRKIGFMVLGLSNAFKTLGTSAAFAGKSVATAGVAAGSATMVSPAPGVTRYAGPLGGTLPLSNRQLRWAQRGIKIGRFQLIRPLDISEPYYDRGSYDLIGRSQRNLKALKEHKRNMRAYNRRLGVLQGLNAAGGVAGMVGVGYGMSRLADADNIADTASGVAYSIAGISAMVGGPWGWGVAIGAAIVGGILQAVGSGMQSTKTAGEIAEFAKKNSIYNGIITGTNDQTMQYLEALHTKHNDINVLIQKRIELTSQLLGLQKGENPMDASTGVFQGLMKKGEDLWDNKKLPAINNVFRNKLNMDRHLVEYEGSYYLTTADALISTGRYEGGPYDVVKGINGEPAVRVGPSGSHGLEAAYASMAATAEIMSPGGYYNKLVQGLRLNIAKLGAKGADDVEMDSYISQIEHAHNPKYLSNLIPTDKITDTDWDLNRMLRDEQTRIYMWGQLKQLLAPMQEAFHKFRAEVGSGNLTTGTLKDYLKNVTGGLAGVAVADYDPNNIEKWFSNYNYANGTFGWTTKTDDSGRVTIYDPQETAKMAAADMQAIIDAIKLSGAAAQPAAAALLDYCNMLLSQANGFIQASNELIDVSKNQELTINGQLYRWNETLKEYEAIDENGNLIYVQNKLVGMGNAIGTLGRNLGFDWKNSFNDFSNSMAGAYSYLNWIGGFKFGAPYLPQTNPGTGLDRPRMSSNGFSFLSGLLFDKPQFSVGSPKFGVNFMERALNKAVGGYMPLTKTLQEASNNIANGDGTAVGWQGNKTGGDNNTDTDNSRYGSHTHDYKSRYSNKAIPKQININIQNLMNVESIDMSNPDNVAVIDNIKREVAYALVEAASDGTMMLNNLGS